MIIIGDLHGELRSLVAVLRENDVRGLSLIQVGDFGTVYARSDFFQGWLADLVAWLDEADCMLYVVRGNHDDAADFPAASPSPRLRYVEDYSVHCIDDRKVLFVGGGVSVDRSIRDYGADEWEAEKFVLDRGKLAALDLDDLWAVVTHTAPDVAPPFGFSPMMRDYAAEDATLLADITAERRALTELYLAIVERTRPSWWLYGHFHAHAVTERDGTRFRMLDMKELLTI